MQRTGLQTGISGKSASSTDKESRLRKRAPAALSGSLESKGILWHEVLLSVDSDLHVDGGPGEDWLIVTSRQIACATREQSRDDYDVRVFSLAEVSRTRLRSTVGSAFIQAEIHGLWVDMIRFDFGGRTLFQRFHARLNEIKEGKHIDLGEEDDCDPRICSRCHFPLEQPNDPCPRCVNKGAVIWRCLLLIRPYWGIASVLLALMILGVGLDLIPPYLTKILVDGVLAQSKQHSELFLMVSGLFGIMIIRSFFVSVLINRLSAKVATNITHDMRNRLFERLQQMSVDFYDRNQVGGLMSRVSNDVEALHEFVVQLTQGFLVNILLILGVGIMLYRLDPLLMMCVLIPAPLVMAATYLFWTRIYPKYFRFWDGNSKLANSLNTAFSGIRLIKAFGQEGREVRRFRENSNYLRETRLTVDQSAGTFFPIFGFCFGIGGLIVWYVGGRQVIDGDITLGTLMAFFGYLGLFYAPLSSLTMLSNWLTRFLTAAQRIFEILDAKPRIVESDQPVTMEKIKGHIVFENVWFGYEPLNPILKDVSFEIKPGEMIGIVGKSGSGKSTLVNLLCRFYDVNQGRVLVDGMDVRQIRRRDLSRNVGLVLQEPFLFRGSVAENIAYGRPDATFEEIMAASKGANCHEFIINLPQGYDTRVGERGAGLSGGERQRISIARALLCDPAILVLDEATSAVDTESERHIQEALNVLTRDRTVIAIAHRLSTLRDANRIFVVDGGRIAESGTHHELLSARGIYHRLVQIQLQMLEEMPS